MKVFNMAGSNQEGGCCTRLRITKPKETIDRETSDSAALSCHQERHYILNCSSSLVKNWLHFQVVTNIPICVGSKL